MFAQGNPVGLRSLPSHPFNEAKANALAMARGAHGDYFVENPIDHLNELQARLEDHQNNEPPAAGTASGSKSGKIDVSK